MRRAVGSAIPVLRVGMGVRSKIFVSGPIVVCGLAGSLTDALPPGTVVVPASVALADGTSVDCDAELQRVFTRACRDLGFEPSSAPLITLPVVVTGSERQTWHARGFAAADMESAVIATRGGRVAVVRVVLDSPAHEISQKWMSPMNAMTRPWLWPEAIRLAAAAPGYARRAARIVSRGLSMLT